MARKPKDIWGLPFPSAQDVVSFMNKTVRDAQIASGDRQARPGTAEYALRDMGRGISATNDYLNPFANTTKQLLGLAAGNEGAREKFAKSLAGDVAITAAAGGVGVAAAKGLNKGARIVGAAIEEGRIVNPSAMVSNFARGNKIIVHGSTQRGLNELIPKSGSIAMPKDEVLFGWDPRAKKSGSWLPTNSLNYTNPKDPARMGRSRITGEQPGSVYIASTPKKKTGSVVTEEKKLRNKDKMLVSRAPAKVIKEIPAPSTKFFETYIPGATSDYVDFKIKLAKELRKAGVFPKDHPIPRPYKEFPVADDF